MTALVHRSAQPRPAGASAEHTWADGIATERAGRTPRARRCARRRAGRAPHAPAGPSARRHAGAAPRPRSTPGDGCASAGRACRGRAPAAAATRSTGGSAFSSALHGRPARRRPRAALARAHRTASRPGSTGIDDDGLVHVARPEVVTPAPPPPGVRVHETRRWRDDDVVDRRESRATRPEVATVQAALWARTDREAALLLVAPVQQRLTTADAVGAAPRPGAAGPAPVTCSGRCCVDVADGVHSLNELDFAAHVPTPRAARARPSGRRRRSPAACYLDVRWRRWRVVVEVDGVGHLQPDRWIDDSLRHNEIALSGDVGPAGPEPRASASTPHRHLDAVERALRQSRLAPTATPRTSEQLTRH